MQSPVRVYVLSRADLTAGQQATQAAHALAGLCVEHPGIAQRWRQLSSYLVLLAVPNEESLLHFQTRVAALPHFLYREPDIGNTVTALAVGPEAIGDVLTDEQARRIFANLPLLLKEHAMA